MILEQVQGLAVALGVGLLVGIERERRKLQGETRAAAGVRSFASVALLGAVCALLNPWLLAAVALGLGALVVASYQQTSHNDPGITTEVALLLTYVLGALALQERGLAAGLGAALALLLAARAPMHRFSRELISESELADGLLLAASALVILPLLPNHTVGPYAVINPWKVWLLVVLIMAISAAGHIALRMVGTRWGLAAAGFFAGYVSSTAAIAGFGERLRQDPALLRPIVGAAMLSNLASLSLFVPLLLSTAPDLLLALTPALRPRH